MDIISFIWNEVLVNPMTNALIILNNVFFGSFGVAIIVFTVVMRAIMFPLTLRQLRSSRALSAIQPKMRELQKKYKDPRRRSEETMKLYREAGVNPLGCLFPMLIQMPIWIALYQVIRLTLGSTPESLISLSHRLYPWSYIQHAVPLSDRFLWLDLARGDLVLALLVGASMFVQQKMMTPPAADERQQSMNSTMLWMFPLMFVWLSLSFPSGLSLYIFVSTLVGIVLQYIYVGSSGLNWRNLFSLQPVGAPQPGSAAKPASVKEETEVEEAPAGTAGERRYKKRSRHGKRRRKR
ncbi:MAG: YidC/Oxa1 family membrane protein insertase [Dehalococcoidia bacterium]|nr:YidC/Oxa1 family membrane protein insertase [Dehalococcoidia bacterium]